MEGCPKCETLIDILQQEISELKGQEGELKRVNDILTTFISQRNTLARDQQDWKEKYEEEARKTHRLEKKIIEMVNNSRSDHCRSSLTGRTNRRSIENIENYSTRSTKGPLYKMETFMNTLLGPRPKGMKDEVVFKIVDARRRRG